MVYCCYGVCSQSFHLLLEPPVFVRCLDSKDVVKGSDLVLEGQLSGSVPFTVSFYKNGKLLRNDKKHKVTVKDHQIALQVLSVEAADTGSYMCRVENEVGNTSSDCQVTLKGILLSFIHLFIVCQ